MPMYRYWLSLQYDAQTYELTFAVSRFKELLLTESKLKQPEMKNDRSNIKLLYAT